MAKYDFDLLGRDGALRINGKRPRRVDEMTLSECLSESIRLRMWADGLDMPLVAERLKKLTQRQREVLGHKQVKKDEKPRAIMILRKPRGVHARKWLHV